MAFWKKSEDPWDRKPDKKKPVIHELDASIQEGEFCKPEKRPWNPGGRLDEWLSQHRAALKEEDAKKLLPPEKCPWCGQDMEQGFLIAARDIYWYPGVYCWISRGRTGSFRIDNDGDFTTYKIAWHCKGCRKMVFDTPNCGDGSPHAGPFPKTEETEEQEETGGE